MFVVSVKSSKLKMLIGLAALVIFLTLGIWYCIGKQENQTEKLDTHAGSTQERVAFLSQFGWSVDETTEEEKDVLIPEKFDDVYEKYNTLQLQQGFDLRGFCGTDVTCWTYTVLNYPGYENDRDHIRANLLVSNGAVIGGDISNVALDGFMEPFDCLRASVSDVEQEVSETVE